MAISISQAGDGYRYTFLFGVEGARYRKYKEKDQIPFMPHDNLNNVGKKWLKLIRDFLIQLKLFASKEFTNRNTNNLVPDVWSIISIVDTGEAVSILTKNEKPAFHFIT